MKKIVMGLALLLSQFGWADNSQLVKEALGLGDGVSVEVAFEYASNVFLSSRSYNPGDTFGELPTPPARTGYVFAGWCRDENLLQAVAADDYVPFTGAHLYAKWAKTLALDNENWHENENWYEGEMTYTTGEKVYRTDVIPEGGDEWGYGSYYYSYLDFDVSGAGFFSFWMNMVGTAVYSITIDGKSVKSSLYFFNPQLTLSNWKKQNLTISGSGTHKVRVTVTGNGFSADTGAALVKGEEFEKYAQQTTLGEWTDKVKNYSCWVTGNLPSLQAKYAADKTPKGRLLHAITTLLTIGENTSFQGLFRGFGHTIDYMNMHVAGKTNFSAAPTGNKIADTLVTIGEPLVKTALADLEAISGGMSPFVLTTEDCAYFDEAVTIDYGDILYIRAALKGLLGLSYWTKAYNVEIDYNQMLKDACGFPLKTVANEASLKTKSGWDGIDWLPSWPEKERGLDCSPLKAVKAGTSVYVYVPHGLSEGTLEYGTVYIECDDPVANKSLWGSYYYQDPAMDPSYVPPSSVTLEAELDDGASVYRFDVRGFPGVTIGNTLLSRIQLVPMPPFVQSWNAGSVMVERTILHQPKIANSIRNSSALTTAKNHVKEALKIWQQADAKVMSRTDDDLHLVEYDAGDEVATRMIAAMRRNLPKALQSLTDGSVQEYEWIDVLTHSHTERYADTLADPLAMNLNKLFTGELTRSVLPKSVSDDYYVPALYELDPTLKGLMPRTTRSEWARFLDAKEIEHSALSPYAFTYEENADGTITLTGIQGERPAGEFYVSAEYDGKKVTAIGRNFLRENESVTSVTIEKGVLSIGEKAFSGCKKLTAVSLPEGLESIGRGAFSGFNPIGQLKSVVIPSTVRTIGSCAFVCNSLESISISGGDNDYFSAENGILYDKVGRRVICSCINLTKAVLPDDCEIIGQDAFSAGWSTSSRLAEIVWPSRLKTIEQGAFHMCTKLKTGDFSSTALELVEEDVFVMCTSLAEVRFPASLRILTGHDFSCCGSLKQVYFAGRPPDVLKKSSSNKDMLDCIYVTTPNLAVAYSDAKQYKYSYLSSVTTYVAPERGWETICETGTWQGRPVKMKTSVTVTAGEGGTATGGGSYDSGAKVALKATPAKGYVFAGWFEGDSPLTGADADYRTASLNYTVPPRNVAITARFVTAAEDRLFIPGAGSDKTVRIGEDFGEALEIGSGSFPTVTVSGLPPGVRFDAKTLKFSGSPTKAGVYAVTISAKNAAGYTYAIQPRMVVTGAEGVRVVNHFPVLHGTVGEEFRKPNGDHYFDVDVFDVDTAPDTSHGEGDLVGFTCDCPGLSQTSMRKDLREHPSDRATCAWYNPGGYYSGPYHPLVATPTKVGTYTLSLKFRWGDGYTETVDTVIVVDPPENDGFPCDISRLDAKDWQVGMPAGEFLSVPETNGLTSLAAANLPAGVKLVRNAASQDGVPYYSLSGSPTKIGSYDVTLTAKSGGQTYTTVRTVHVVDVQSEFYSVLSADPSRGTVTGGGVLKPGAKMAVNATAKPGYVFAGWYRDAGCQTPARNYDPYAADTLLVADYRTASQTWTVQPGPYTPNPLYARFVSKADDATISVSCDFAEAGYPAGRALSVTAEVTSASFPTVTASGLPAGMKFDAKTLAVSGVPTTPGEYKVKLTAKNVSGASANGTFTLKVQNYLCSLPLDYEGGYTLTTGVAIADTPVFGSQSLADWIGWTVTGLPAGVKFDSKTGAFSGAPTAAGVSYTLTLTKTEKDSSGAAVTEKGTVTVRTEAAPSGALGAFNGFVCRGEGDGVDMVPVHIGTFALSSTDRGALSAKAVMASGTYSFTAPQWDLVDGDGCFGVEMEDRSGNRLALALDPQAAWDRVQVEGVLYLKGTQREYAVLARGNPFGTPKWQFAVEAVDDGAWALSYAESASQAALTLTLKADGAATLTGKVGSVSVNATTVVSAEDLRSGAIVADFAPVVTVGGAKRILDISINLWLDRSNESHSGEIGEIRLVSE